MVAAGDVVGVRSRTLTPTRLVSLADLPLAGGGVRLGKD